MSGVLRFGVFELDLRSRELRKRGMRLHLPEQSFEILAMLVERPGDVVSREEIRARLWPHGTVVEFEHSVNSAVRRLRDCLGDSATTPRFVETLPRRGYRFLAPVEAGQASPSAPHFRILGELGRGGMGVVYKAEDRVLGRTVALKFLPEALASHPPSVERFGREARTLASVNHPGICALHGVEEHDGRACLVMEYLEGQPLSRLIEGGPLPLKQALRIAADASEALAAAHALGIVHHDVAPANIFVTGEGHVKLLDFGLAEIVRRGAARDGVSVRAPAPPVTDGSPADFAAADGSSDYMSPEQVRGEAVEARTDVYSLGVVLYEMLCGRRPFCANSRRSILTAILEDEPASPRTLRRDIPHRVERLLLQCLEKKPEDRYSSAAELHRELDICLASTESGAWRRPAAVAAVTAAALLLAAMGFIGVRAAMQASRSRWVEREALPAVARLIQEERPLAALDMIRNAERLAAPPAELVRFKDRLPPLRVSVRTTPPGAAISALDYADKDDRDTSRWVQLGRSPLETDRLPAGDYRVRAVKDGFETVERLFAISADAGKTIELELHARASVPPEMVWISGTGPKGLGKTMFPALPDEVPGFWLDRHEVTNREFRRFVEAGGYQRRELWKQPFIKAGRTLAWEEAMLEFRDPSGKAGPSTWELGSYPEGRADHPVGGVSWYEAAAYAEFAGKSLPTVFHWLHAAGVGMGTFFRVLEFSNLSGQGPARAESYRGLGPFGSYDMAGNVREWCWTPVGKFRYILGGGWNDPMYQLSFPNALDPFMRGASNGFRCARYASPLAETLAGEVPFVPRDRRGDKPADDDAYRIYRGLHSYDKADLYATVESVDDTSPYWRREKISFQAAYVGERVVAHLFLPRNARPPYQAVVYFPGSTALVAPRVDSPGVIPVYAERVVQSGRALLLPAYKGMLERGPGAYYHWLGQPNRWREMNLQWSKDLGRSLDYIESRGDVDARKLAFIGGSLGGAVGPLLIALEPRFKVAVLVSGGSFERVPPEVDPWNFAPHVKIPVLMQNGRDDFLFAVEASQLPLYRLLGTPKSDKKHLLYDGAHNISARLDLARDMLDWLDRYLGPVDLRR
jgi:formylglycine-generating enzyme required for sulfatase activity/DNA-binding winged helix-turn-helix (wHTH) protein/dienelactone hydrolase/predicted Ser/Thr protein kinase